MGRFFVPKVSVRLKKRKGLCRLPTAFVWLRIQFTGGGGAKYFQGEQLPPLLPAPMRLDIRQVEQLESKTEKVPSLYPGRGTLTSKCQNLY